MAEIINKKIRPRCHPYWVIDGNMVKNKNQIQAAYTATDYLLPCCWIDGNERQMAELEVEGLLNKKVSEVSDLKEILHSKEWEEFHSKLFNGKSNLRKCHDKCGV